MSKEDYLTKSSARQVLIRNFGSLDRAKLKLEDKFLLTAFNSTHAPCTKKVITYLKNLNYNVQLLHNVCQSCGILYSFSNLATDKSCQMCANKSRYSKEMIVEPETVTQLLHNLEVLRKYFDTPEDTTHADLIEAVKLHWNIKDEDTTHKTSRSIH